MAVNYWITFRIEDVTVGGRHPDTRRSELYETIRQIADRVWWTEPTSFILFPTLLGIDEVASRVRECVSEVHDIVLIREAESKNARVVGPVDDDVYQMMPYLKAA